MPDWLRWWGHLGGRLDEMKDRLELWVLRAADDRADPSPLRGLLHLAQVAEDLGRQALQMVQLIERQEKVHPVLAVALGESDDVVLQIPVARASAAVGRTLSELRLSTDSGFTVLAISRSGQYWYRPAWPSTAAIRRRVDSQRAGRGPRAPRRDMRLAPGRELA